MAIGVEYETGIAKIGNQVKAIISTQLAMKFLRSFLKLLAESLC